MPGREGDREPSRDGEDGDEEQCARRRTTFVLSVCPAPTRFLGPPQQVIRCAASYFPCFWCCFNRVDSLVSDAASTAWTASFLMLRFWFRFPPPLLALFGFIRQQGSDIKWISSPFSSFKPRNELYLALCSESPGMCGLHNHHRSWWLFWLVPKFSNTSTKPILYCTLKI